MAIICTTCEGYGTYYLRNNQVKDCETCNTTGLIEQPDDTEDMSVKLKNWYTILDEEVSNLTDYKYDIENSLNRLEEMVNKLAGEVLE